jgi:hypothetical protein
MRKLISGFQPRRRGFLLLLIVGLLSVLLVVIVGFLSFTRTELTSVAHVRDRADTNDLSASAMDWAIGNIANYVLDPATKTFDSTKYVSNASDTTPLPTGGGGQWWYAPYDPNVKTINNAYTSGGAGSFVSLFMQQNAATWRYMPDDFFPDGSISGRFAVQVLDANSAININDWLDDCNPTQCQMAHMIQGAQGLNYFEQYRAHLDNGGTGAVCTIPYTQAWNVASRTVRYFKYNWSYTGNYTAASPNYITTNTQWTGMFGPEYVGMKTTYYDQYLGWWWGQPWWDECGMASFTIANHSDPDTGRSPLNVNTCEASGNSMPFSGENQTWAWPLEGVFNLESLARIIKVGKFHFNGTTLDAQAPASWPGGVDVPGAWQHVEYLRMRLAYRYQEMMVRYFCGKYKPYLYGNNYGCVPGNWNMQWLFRHASPGNPSPDGFSENRNYYQAFAYNGSQSEPRGALNASEANKVLHAVLPDGTNPADSYPLTAYYKKTRFPCSLETFRQWVAQDLITMTQNNNDWAGSVDPGYGSTSNYSSTYTLRYDDPGVTPDGKLCVNFDQNDTPEIIPGKLDYRTANAIFDNIIPGKLWKGTDGNQHYLLNDGSGFSSYTPGPNDVTGNGVRDPLWELYCYQVGRDEYNVDSFNRQGFYFSSTGNPILGDRGKDHLYFATPPVDLPLFDSTAVVPWRQLAFGPDWFSTELTITSPTYYLVVTSEIVEKQSAVANPANPTVLTHNQVLACVELAADVNAETDASYDGTGWPTGGVTPDPTHPFTMAELKKVGLGYYRGANPRRLKTAKASDPLSMDYGMKTVFQVNSAGAQGFQPALPDTSLKNAPTSGATSVPTAAPDWVDYRGVKAGNENAYYRPQLSPGDAGRQTSNRAVVRWTWTINQGL